MLTQSYAGDKMFACNPGRNWKNLICTIPIANFIDLFVTISNTFVKFLVTGGNTLSRFLSDVRPTEITLVIVLISLLILLPPLLGLWISTDSAWYLPYLIWFCIIVLAYWLQKLLRKNAI